MDKYKLKDGFEFEINPDVMKDMRLLDAFITIDDKALPEVERATAMIKALGLLLGQEQKDRLYRHIADNNDGCAKPELVGKAFFEITKSIQKDKKK